MHNNFISAKGLSLTSRNQYITIIYWYKILLKNAVSFKSVSLPHVLLKIFYTYNETYYTNNY